MPKSNDQNTLLCDKCCDEAKNKVAQLKSKAKPLPKENYVPYFCGRCRYNFRVDEAKIGLTYALNCPYCGKEDQLEKKI